MPKFIVLSGKKQAGKTTCASFIQEYINEARPDLIVKTTSFAAPIKQFCRDILGLSYKQIFGTDEEKNSDTHIMWDNMPSEIRLHYDPLPIPPKCDSCGHQEIWFMDGIHNGKTGPMTAREVMQIFGTDIMRKFFHTDVWAKAPFNKDWMSTDVVIIDDCRFPNEGDIALEYGASLIRLNRNPLQDTHLSETAMDAYDKDKYTYIINNISMSLKELNTAICRMMHLGERYTK